MPTRTEVATEDTWNLSELFPDDAAWERTFTQYQEAVPGYTRCRGTRGEVAEALAACLKFDSDRDRRGDRVGTYAMLRETEDVANSTYQGFKSRYIAAATKAMELGSYLRPEILALSDETLQAYLAHPALADRRKLLERLVRTKPHTLSDKEERLLAMQMNCTQTPREVFNSLTNADMTFGKIALDGTEIDLSHGSYSRCLESPDRAVRMQAFRQYYAEYEAHANTLAATLGGSVKQDVYQAAVRNYPSAREAALHPDHVPVTVYDNLIAAVRKNLPAVHKYYAIRQRAMKLESLHFYDTYTPILAGFRKNTPWNDAVDVVLESLAPLGKEYTGTLADGLRGRWCDKYENRGKRSGAFSSGCYDSPPYILMNYQPDVLDHVFTLTHEAGHSLHTHLSKAQPYHYANYTIFVAEVASTFNEQLLAKTLMERASSAGERAYYINREIDAMRATIVRQTMFAEFEKIIHHREEAGEPLTLAAFRGEYRTLLEAYHGPGMTLDDQLSLECLRIPHFYGAFYVYKYATGLSAAIALSQRVLQGGATELADYKNFLRAGGSLDPLDALRAAGVDMTTPEPVDAALRRFAALVDELDTLV